MEAEASQMERRWQQDKRNHLWKDMIVGGKKRLRVNFSSGDETETDVDDADNQSDNSFPL